MGTRPLLPSLTDPEPGRPGRKPGSPKVPGSGRRVGTPNKPRVDLREMILNRGRPIELLCDISRGVKIRVGPQAGPEASFAYPSLQERAAAARILIDKLIAAAPAAVPPGEGGPAPEVSDFDLSKHIAYLLYSAADIPLESKRPTPTPEKPAPQPDPEAVLTGKVDEVLTNADTTNVTPLKPEAEQPFDPDAPRPERVVSPVAWFDSRNKPHSVDTDGNVIDDWRLGNVNNQRIASPTLRRTQPNVVTKDPRK